jgi:hypothetical protein
MAVTVLASSILGTLCGAFHGQGVDGALYGAFIGMDAGIAGAFLARMKADLAFGLSSIGSRLH